MKRHSFLFNLAALVTLTASSVVFAADERTTWDSYIEVRNQMRQHKREKNLDKARSLNPRLLAVFEELLNDSTTSNGKKISAGTTAVNAVAGDDLAQANAIIEKLLALPDLKPGDKANILCVAAGIADDPVAEYEKALTIPGLEAKDEISVLSKLANRYWRADRDQRKLRAIVERVLTLTPKGKSAAKWTRILADFKAPSTSYRDPKIVEFAWEKFLNQDDVAVKDKARAHAELIETKIRLGKNDEARKLAETVKSDDAMPVATRLMADLTLLGLDADGDAPVIDENKLHSTMRSAKANPIDAYQALNEATAALKTLGEGSVARQYAEIAREMVERPNPIHLCRFMETPPLGTAGWFASDWIKDPKNGVRKFKDYRQEDAAALVTDVNADRAVSDKEKDKQFYFENTSFHMVYDDKGWHIFVLCGERDVEKRKVAGESLGALEMYFAPTPERPYYQWIVRLDTGETSFYDWSSPNRSFRPAKDFMTTETRVLGDQIGVYVFIPWEMVSDALPFDSDDDWLFEFIRWSPAGGVSWSGGTVHNTGKWGTIDWEKPAPKILSKLRERLLRLAWLKYQKSKKELVADHWASRDFGDPEFMKTTLGPIVKKLDELGKPLDDEQRLSEADVKRLWNEALNDWGNFDYLVSEARRDYLAKRLTNAELAEKAQ